MKNYNSCFFNIKKKLFISAVCIIFATPLHKINAQEMTKKITAPVATIKPHQLKKHKDVRIDNYYWLKDRENPEVINYLNQENNY